MMKAADDKSGCRRRSRRHNILRHPAPLLCLDNTFVAIVAVVVNDDDDGDSGGVPPSTLPEAAAAVVDVVVVVIRILDGRRWRRGGQTTRLPGKGGGSYCPHHWMDGVAHGFVRLPPRLAAETAMTTASAGGPAGPPPRLCARRQARAATSDDDEDYDRVGTEEQATRCASGWRPATQLSSIAGRRATTKRAVDKRKQQPTIAH